MKEKGPVKDASKPLRPRYEDLFCSRVSKMRASEIRELLKLVQNPEVISFAGGLPNPLAFPVERVNEIVNDLLRESPAKVLQYGSTEGVPELREQIAKRLKRVWNIEGDKDLILVTVGSQQGLDLLGRLFIGDGNSHLIMEAPTYLGALNAFNVFEPHITSIPMDGSGMPMDALEESLQSLRKRSVSIKFLYTVPTFHNPAGVCMSLPRRKKLIDLSHEYDFLIVEDDPYGELRYDGEHIPPLKSLDREDRVIYLGTFSKTLVPGLRIAWTLGPKPIIQKMVIAKQAVDLCAPPFSQHIALEYLSRGYIDEHLKKIISIYGKKQKIMLEAMEQHMPREHISWTKAHGGMFFWATLSKGIHTADMLQDAVAQNVAYVPGHAFFADGSGTNCMRLNFTHPEDERIVEGVKRLSSVIGRWGREKGAPSNNTKGREIITGV